MKQTIRDALLAARPYVLSFCHWVDAQNQAAVDLQKIDDALATDLAEEDEGEDHLGE